MKILRKKAARYILAVFIIASLNFIIPRAMPGDPITNLLGEDFLVSEEDVKELKAQLGLDKPLATQFLSYWRDILRFDLGYSYHYNARVSALIFSRMKWTLLLVGPAVILGAVIGTLLGAFSGWYKNKLKNKITTSFFLTVYSTPPYFLSIILLYLFSFKLNLTPLKGFYTYGGFLDILSHLLLPCLVLTLFSASRNYVIMRGSVLQEKISLYVEYARAKGLPSRSILFRHVFKNASLPVITLIALDFGFILSGALFVEIIFSMNGMGTLIYDALMSRDYPVLQGIFLIITLLVITANVAADLLYSLIDPRVRLRR
jgi:peptide/nickel transport system permease protein